MWEDDDDDIERSGTFMDRVFSGIYRDLGAQLLAMHAGALRPLYRMEVGEESVLLAFDLPGARKKDIQITCTEDLVSLEARISTTSKVPGARGRVTHLEHYAQEVRLPVRVNPTKAKAKHRNGMLVVRLPIVRAGRSIVITD